MVPDELQQLWQEEEKMPIALDVVVRGVRFEDQLERRNLREQVAAVLVAVVFLAAALWLGVHERWLMALGGGSIAAAAVSVAWTLTRRGRAPQRLNAGSTREFLETYRAELEWQVDLLKAAPRWYVLPFVPGVTLFCAAAASSPGAPGRMQWISGLVFAVCVGVGVLAIWINRRASRALEAELASLSGIAAPLDDK